MWTMQSFYTAVLLSSDLLDILMLGDILSNWRLLHSIAKVFFLGLGWELGYN